MGVGLIKIQCIFCDSLVFRSLLCFSCISTCVINAGCPSVRLLACQSLRLEVSRKGWVTISRAVVSNRLTPDWISLLMFCAVLFPGSPSWRTEGRNFSLVSLGKVANLSPQRPGERQNPQLNPIYQPPRSRFRIQNLWDCWPQAFVVLFSQFAMSTPGSGYWSP